MSSTQHADELIVGCLAASGAIAAVSTLGDGNVPGLRLAVGLGVTGAALATVALFQPDLAGSFAALVLTTTLFVYGEPALRVIQDITGPTGQTAPSSTKRTIRSSGVQNT